MANLDIWIWVAVIAVSLIVEFVSMEIVSVWFSVAGLVALILAAFTVSFEIQIIVFIVLAMFLVTSLRRWAKNKLLNSDGTSNIDLVKKEKLKLLSKITPTESGTVKYNGIIWTAISETEEEIKEGEWVVVSEIKGNKLIVKKEGNK
jgi:membrane protein implicated in regulation of membrane protease activity